MSRLVWRSAEHELPRDGELVLLHRPGRFQIVRPYLVRFDQGDPTHEGDYYSRNKWRAPDTTVYVDSRDQWARVPLPKPSEPEPAPSAQAPLFEVTA